MFSLTMAPDFWEDGTGLGKVGPMSRDVDGPGLGEDGPGFGGDGPGFGGDGTGLEGDGTGLEGDGTGLEGDGLGFRDEGPVVTEERLERRAEVPCFEESALVELEVLEGSRIQMFICFFMRSSFFS